MFINLARNKRIFILFLTKYSLSFKYNYSGEYIMGYFKSVSKRKKLRNKIVCFLIICLILLYFIYHFKDKQIKQNYISTSDVALLSLPLKKDDDPIIYIYNTHQTEKYLYDKLNPYNIDYTVMYASYILSMYLDSYNIKSIVESTSMPKLLESLNLKYNQSYIASRTLLEKAKNDYPTLKYFFDIHRDSSSYDKTTCEYNNKLYAKVLFVIGLEHDNYKDNRLFANKLNNMLIDSIPCISRGILEKSGPGVDGIYNEDFDKNTLLFEIGGQYNSIEEVNNTLLLLARIINDYLKEEL